MTIIEDVAVAASWMATAPTSSGYRADFTAASQRAMKRYANSSEEDIAAYAAALGLDVGQRPPPPT